MPIMKKPGGGNTPAKTGNTPPAKPSSGPKRDAFAEKLASTESAAGGTWTPPPPGTYNALVTEAQGEVDGDKTDAYLEMTIVDHDELAGKTCRIYYNFTDENGEDKGGMPYFRQMLEMFGYKPEDITSWDMMCETIAAIAQDNTWCIIDVKKRGKYTNIFLSSVPENQSEKPSLE